MKQKPIIVWFRQNLRLHDNPVLNAAAKIKQPVLFLYILDTEKESWPMGSASRWWLHHSLSAFSTQIAKRFKGQLVLQKGSASIILTKLIKQTQATHVLWDRRYEPEKIITDNQIQKQLERQGITVETFNTFLLHEPWDYQTKAKQPFKGFTPFWKNCQTFPVSEIMQTVKTLSIFQKIKSLSLKSLGLLPKIAWYEQMAKVWLPGEQGAQKQWSRFLKHIKDYKNERNYPALESTSKLSPHLHFGEISPQQIWHDAQALLDQHPQWQTSVDTFLKEIAWREFSYHLLYYYPDLPNQPYNQKFKQFSWRYSKAQLYHWQKGLTGYPIVDAGMRELWATGWMHNRVRMIVASFLTKHLRLPWQQGEAWFWDTLVDADLANNAASWQWVAGCGFDAAPYFRIFNPTLQAKQFDSDGVYIKRWLPELKHLDNRYIHTPWEAPKPVQGYPKPIVDHIVARQSALTAYKRCINAK